MKAPWPLGPPDLRAHPRLEERIDVGMPGFIAPRPPLGPRLSLHDSTLQSDPSTATQKRRNQSTHPDVENSCSKGRWIMASWLLILRHRRELVDHAFVRDRQENGDDARK